MLFSALLLFLIPTKSSTQAIFTHKIYTFSKSWFYPAICWFVLVVRVALSIVVVVEGLNAVTIPSFTQGKAGLLTSLISVAAGSDVMIAAGLIYYFRNRRSDALSEYVLLQHVQPCVTLELTKLAGATSSFSTD
jgi:uncharacterized protein YjeT (DUF2065 family)